MYAWEEAEALEDQLGAVRPWRQIGGRPWVVLELPEHPSFRNGDVIVLNASVQPVEVRDGDDLVDMLLFAEAGKYRPSLSRRERLLLLCP